MPVSTWMRAGALTERETDAARLHPYHGERALTSLGGDGKVVAALVQRHHERLDGSGYYRNSRGPDLSPAARILAAAEAFQTAREARPHRPASSDAAAAAKLRAAVREGKLCPDAVEAVLACAGQPARRAIGRAAGGADPARDRGLAADRGRRHGQGSGPQARHRDQDRRQPHPEPLFEDRRHHPRGRGPLRPRARPGSARNRVGIGNLPHVRAGGRRHSPSVNRAIGPGTSEERAHEEASIKVGVIADQTGPLSFMGIANANVARMVDRRHQREGRPAGAPARADRRGQRDDRQRRRGQGDEARRARQGRRDLRRHLQLHPAGHQGPGRREGEEALHLPRAVRGPGVRPADLLHRPGAGAAGRSAHPLADARDRREEVLPAVGRLHLAARAEQAGAPGGHGQRRHDRRRGVLPARSRRLRADGREDHVERRRGGVQHHRSARRLAVPRAALRLRLHRSAAASSSAPTSTRTSSTWCRPRTSRGSTAASTTTRPSAIRSARRCSRRYDKRFPGSAKFTGGSACSGLYRGLKLWEAAVKEAGSLEQDDVIRALDHAQIAEGPGGPAEMVPGQHHVRMNMYIAQAVERPVPDRQEPRRHRAERGAGASGRRASRRAPPFDQRSSQHDNNHKRRHDHDARNDEGRRFRPLPRRSSRPRAPRSGSSTAPRARPSSAIPSRPTGSG